VLLDRDFRKMAVPMALIGKNALPI